MKVIGWLLAASVALAVLRAALAVLIAGLFVLLIVTLWINPQAVLGFLALCIIGATADRHPIGLGIFIIVILLIDTFRRPGLRG
jgi:hypothetical protein